jgi:hypothetical protein
LIRPIKTFSKIAQEPPLLPEGSLFTGKFKKEELLKPFGIKPLEETGRTTLKPEVLNVPATPSSQPLTIDTVKKEVFIPSHIDHSLMRHGNELRSQHSSHNRR